MHSLVCLQRWVPHLIHSVYPDLSQLVYNPTVTHRTMEKIRYMFIIIQGIQYKVLHMVSFKVLKQKIRSNNTFK